MARQKLTLALLMHAAAHYKFLGYGRVLASLVR